MSPFDYVSVLLSMVLSLAIAHVFNSIAHMISAGVRNVSLPLAYWMAFCLFLIVDFWFSMWTARQRPDWSLGYVGFLLTQCGVIYVLSRVIAPSALGDRPVDMSAHFEASRRKFMVIGAALLLLSQLTNWTLPAFHSLPIFITAASFLAIFVIGYFIRSQRAHLALCAVSIIVTADYSLTFIPAL